MSQKLYDAVVYAIGYLEGKNDESLDGVRNKLQEAIDSTREQNATYAPPTACIDRSARRAQVAEALLSGPQKPADLARKTGINGVYIYKLLNHPRFAKLADGTWALSELPPTIENGSPA